MRKPTLLLVLGLFGCLTLAVVAQQPPAAEHPGADARNRMKDIRANLHPWKPAPDALRSLAVLEELVGEIRSTQQQLLRLGALRDPQVRRQALIVLAEVSRARSTALSTSIPVSFPFLTSISPPVNLSPALIPARSSAF